MIDLPQSLKDHIAGTITTLAFCWTITRKDGATFGFTDHDMPLTINAIIHDPQTGLTATAAESELGLSISTMDVEGALRSDKISEADLKKGLFDNAQVETFLVDWTNPASFALIRKSRIGRIEITGNSFRAELQSLTQALDQRKGRLVRRSCDAQLGDNRCKKLISGGAYVGAGVVSGVVGTSDFTVSGLSSFAARWFEHGELTWLTGLNAGQISQIAIHEKSGAVDHLSVWLSLSETVAIGDSFTIKAGCDKAFSTCKAKFSNQLNFQGFPHLPGNDAVYSYVDGTGIFDGAALVP